MALYKFPVISVKGEPFECGLQYGSQAGDLIRRNIDLYFNLWNIMLESKRPEIIERCREFIPVIGEYDADILEELEGLAKGANLSLEEIVTLNARYELIWGERMARKFSFSGCTSAVALPEVTKNGHTIIGKNYDMGPLHFDFCVILKVEQNNKPNIVISTEAGFIGGKGMNSAGLGVCGNGLVSNLDRFAPGVPWFIMKRGVLNAENFARSLKAVLDAPTAISGNMLIAHRDGVTIDLEITPEDVGVIQAEEGILTHSNHFLTTPNREDFRDVLKRYIPNTLYRHQRARRLLESDRGDIDIGCFQRMFSDHFSYPDSICWHPNPRDDELSQLGTITSTIMDLEDRSMYITEGYPCENKYVKLSLQNFLGQ